MSDDIYRNTAFEPFYENFEGPVRSGIYAERYRIDPPTPRQRLRRFWRQPIVPQPWKPCVRISCPEVEEYEINFTTCTNTE